MVRPVLFSFDPESAHDRFSSFGEWLGSNPVTRAILKIVYRYQNPALEQRVAGVFFSNPVGLAAGFDYDGHMAEVMGSVGFSFNTVGTVTAGEYQGNPRPRLVRLPKSSALLVNKGFKSEGAQRVLLRLKEKNLLSKTIGISVGSTNVPQVNSTEKALADYCLAFQILKDQPFVKYFELNISCPNISLKDNFTAPENFKRLAKAVQELEIKKPMFVKMPSEMEKRTSEEIIRIGMSYGIRGYIFSNLVKSRVNEFLDKQEAILMSDLKGNISGRPVYSHSLENIKEMRRVFGEEIVLIGCGGIFSAEDAYSMIRAGASLVQLITGMIYEGPQLVGQINRGLVRLLKRDGFSHISQAIGADTR